MGNCCSQIFKSQHKAECFEMQIKEFRKAYKLPDFPENLAFTHDPELFRMKNKTNQQSVMLKRFDFSGEDDLSHFVKKLDKIMHIEHDNLLKIYNYAVEKNEFKDLTLCYTLNVAFEGFGHTLQDELLFRTKANQPFAENEIRTFLRALVDLLEFLQLKNINLENLNPSKIYICSNKHPKLLYFGETPAPLPSCSHQQHFLSTDNTPCQRLNQSVEPNFAEKQHLNSQGASPKATNQSKSNVYSLGLIVLEMMSVKKINKTNNYPKTVRHQYKAVEASGVYGPLILSLVKTMLKEDELVRPDFLGLKKMIMMEEYMNTNLPNNPKKEAKIPKVQEMNTLKENQLLGNDYKIDNPLKIHLDSCDVTGINLLEGMGEEYIAKQGSKGGLDTSMIRLEEDSRHELSQTKADTNTLNDIKDGTSKRPEVYEEFLKTFGEEEDIHIKYEDLEIQSENDLLEAYNKKNIKSKKLTISLEETKFDREVAGRIGEVIGRQSCLDELVLELPNGELDTEGLVAIAKGIEKIKGLSICYIDLRKLKITDRGVQALGECLETKSRLTDLTLNLSDTLISEQNCQEISQWFRKLDNLNSLALNLGGNNIRDKGVALIGKGVRYLENLESAMIFLYENELTGKEGISDIFTALLNLKKLKKINLNFVSNLLGDDEMEVIHSFAMKSEAEEITINLKDNNVSEEKAKKIEDEFANSTTVTLRF